LGDHPVISLNVAVVDDICMAELHKRYMGDPSPTDVLTFDLRDNRKSTGIEGEIVISADTARREARRRKLDEGDELLRYSIHGVLHLLGLDDRTAIGRRRMRREETRILRELRTGAARLKPTTRKSSRSIR
jgi:probable rRNA maturation factor